MSLMSGNIRPGTRVDVLVLHKGLLFFAQKTEKLYCGEFVSEFSGFEPQAVRRLQILDSATSLDDLTQLPSNRFEALKGDGKSQYSIRINRQWRICFKWDDDRPQEVEITDHH